MSLDVPDLFLRSKGPHAPAPQPKRHGCGRARKQAWTGVAALLAAGCSVPTGRAVATVNAAPAPLANQPVTTAAIAQGNASFGVSLYKALSGEEGNVFLSPISVAGAFGPALAGAQGETRTAIAKAIGLPGEAGDELHSGLGGLLRGLERQQKGASVSIANALWVKKGFALKPDFVRIARKDYDATAEPLDFGGAPVASANRINNWVNQETRGRIRNLISPSSLNSYTALVITNAVHFLGDWAEAFDKSRTTDQPFYGPGGTTRQVPLMRMTEPFRYLERDGFQAIDLPYKDPRLSMSVFLPKERDGLSEFERRLTGERLREWLVALDAAGRQEVQLFLPKLQIEQSYNLVPPLKALGMEIAFAPRRADFRGIADHDMFISQVVHKTFVRIDEKGTEAAAATGIGVQVTGARISKPPVFRADHPFFFLLRDKESGAILFLGRIVAPERPPAV